MNPKDSRNAWSRLVTAARHLHDDRPTEAPYGFSTRVAANAFAAWSPGRSLLDRFALRALGVAAVLAIASVAVNYTSLKPKAPTATDEYQPAAADDPMAVLLDA